MSAGISRITLISSKDSGQSDGLHSANLANELFEFTKGNIFASNYKNQWEEHQDFTKIQRQRAAILET